MLIWGACTEEAVARPEPTVEPEPDTPKLEALSLVHFVNGRGFSYKNLYITPAFNPDSLNYRVTANWAINEIGIYAKANYYKSVITVRFNDSLLSFFEASQTYEYRTTTPIQGTFVLTVTDKTKNIAKTYSITPSEITYP